jgi:hypothetical protein
MGDDGEIVLQIVNGPRCGFHAFAAYRESRHGASDSESWRHEGYRVGTNDSIASPEPLGPVGFRNLIAVPGLAGAIRPTLV